MGVPSPLLPVNKYHRISPARDVHRKLIENKKHKIKGRKDKISKEKKKIKRRRNNLKLEGDQKNQEVTINEQKQEVKRRKRIEGEQSDR